MAEISFQCPECGHSYRFGPDLAGKRGRCKSCQAVFRIPEASPASTPTPASSPAPRIGEPGKVDLNCPRCGHAYRLDAKLAGKQARCTICREAFTIPAAKAPAPSRPMMTFNEPLSGLPSSRPATSTPAARPSGGDSGYWELDSSESIPTTTARPASARSRPAPIVTATLLDDDDGIVTAAPVRSNWVVWASVGGGGVVGLVFMLILFKALSSKPAPAPDPDATIDPPTVVATPGPSLAKPTSDVVRHREALDALVQAYNRIADGYARIRDARSVKDGQPAIRAAVEDLQTASRRGQELPTLPADDRRKLIQQQAPRLIQAINRVIGELRRLQVTSGIRSDFEGLIASYSRRLDEIRRELDASRSGSVAPG